MRKVTIRPFWGVGAALAGMRKPLSILGQEKCLFFFNRNLNFFFHKMFLIIKNMIQTHKHLMMMQ